MKFSFQLIPCVKKYMHCMILIALLDSFVCSVHAQSVQNLETALSTLSVNNEAEANALSNLVYGVQPTAYFTADGFSFAGDGASKVLDVTMTRFNSIDFSNPAIQGVELIIIRFEHSTDLSATISLWDTANLGSLQHILLLSAVETNASELELISGGLQGRANLYYAISIPE
jgi:hypothetical protein